MSQAATDIPISISTCDMDHAAMALRLVFGDLPEPDREAMVHGLLTGGNIDVDGLLVAYRNGGIIGAIWAQSQPGRTAILWPPGGPDPERGTLDNRLIAAAVEFLSSADITMAQTLLKSEQVEARAGFQLAGFQELTQLTYLDASANRADRSPKSELQFRTFQTGEESRLGELIERTYIDSLDCPALDGKRDVNDTIAGYRATGEFDPARWFFVQVADQDIGVLLLTAHPPAPQWELVYMGIVPEARGRGLGKEIAAYSLDQAARSGARKVVVAVDARNTPAIDAYEQVGFSVWDRRTVLLKQFDSIK